MAAPASATIENLNGSWVMNKSLSDPTDPPLVLQGIGWLTRKAIGLATITLHIKQYKDDAGVVHVDIDQTATGGIKGTSEMRQLDNSEREHKDHVFGRVKGRSQFVKLSEVSDDFLKNNWLPESVEGQVISTNVDSLDNGWTAEQIWGFEEVNGERRYVRHAVVKKGGERINTRLVYDYQA